MTYICSFLVAQMIKTLPAMQETQVGSPGQEDLLKKYMVTHSVLLPGESHGQRCLVGYIPWGHKELDMTEHARNIKGMVSATPWLRPCTLDNHMFGCE